MPVTQLACRWEVCDNGSKVRKQQLPQAQNWICEQFMEPFTDPVFISYSPYSDHNFLKKHFKSTVTAFLRSELFPLIVISKDQT